MPVLPYVYRCGQPAQQQGRRIPLPSLDIAFFMRMPLVSASLPEMTQQIHSFLANGVMSSHNAVTFLEERIAFPRSAGSLCTVPEESLAMWEVYQSLRSAGRRYHDRPISMRSEIEAIISDH